MQLCLWWAVPDKVMETLQAKEASEADLPSAVFILSEKNYITVWDIAPSV